jgi:hypothetical protein
MKLSALKHPDKIPNPDPRILSPDSEQIFFASVSCYAASGGWVAIPFSGKIRGRTRDVGRADAIASEGRCLWTAHCGDAVVVSVNNAPWLGYHSP